MESNIFKIIVSSIGGIILIREIIKELEKKRKYYYLKGYLKTNKYRFRSFPFLISIRNKNFLNISGKDKNSNRFCFTLSYSDNKEIICFLHVVYRLKNKNIGNVFNFLIPKHNKGNSIPPIFKTNLLEERKGLITDISNNYKFIGEKDNLVYNGKIIDQLDRMEFATFPFIKYNNKNIIIGFNFDKKINETNISNCIKEGLNSLNEISSFLTPLQKS